MLFSHWIILLVPLKVPLADTKQVVVLEVLYFKCVRATDYVSSGKEVCCPFILKPNAILKSGLEILLASDTPFPLVMVQKTVLP